MNSTSGVVAAALASIGWHSRSQRYRKSTVFSQIEQSGQIQLYSSEFIRAWDQNAAGGTYGWAIIDSVMNLSLLYWATVTTGDPRFQLVAKAHTDTVLREFLRPDGSCYHIVEFDPATGHRIRALAGQGQSSDSAWALYGFAVGYGYTKEVRYLDAAKTVAHFFLAALPRDGVPYWDFRLPSWMPCREIRLQAR